MRERHGRPHVDDFPAAGTTVDGVPGHEGDAQGLEHHDAVFRIIGIRDDRQRAEPGAVFLIQRKDDIPEHAGAGDVIGQGFPVGRGPQAQLHGAGVVGTPPDLLGAIHGVVGIAEAVLEGADEPVVQFHLEVRARPPDITVHHLFHREHAVEERLAHHVALHARIPGVQDRQDVRGDAHVLPVGNLLAAVDEGPGIDESFEVVGADTQSVAHVVVLERTVAGQLDGPGRGRQGIGVVEDEPGVDAAGVVQDAFGALRDEVALVGDLGDQFAVGLVQAGRQGVVVAGEGILHGVFIDRLGQDRLQPDEALAREAPVVAEVAADAAAGAVAFGTEVDAHRLVRVQAAADASVVPGGGAYAVHTRVIGDDRSGLDEGLRLPAFVGVGGLGEAAVQRPEGIAEVGDLQEIEGEDFLSVHAHDALQARSDVLGDELVVIDGRGVEEARADDFLAVRAVHAPERGTHQTGQAHVGRSQDAAALLGQVHIAEDQGEDDVAGAVRNPVQFGLALLDPEFAESILVELADVVVFSGKDPSALKVDESVFSVYLDLGTAIVVELLRVIEGRVDDPVLLLVLIAVLLGLLVLDRFEILGLQGCAQQQRRQDCEGFHVLFHTCKNTKKVLNCLR